MLATPLNAVSEDADVAVLTPFVRALEGAIEPPYRARAVRQDATTWAIGSVGIWVAELPGDLDGDELTLTVASDEAQLVVDGRPSFFGIDALRRLVGDRWQEYVLRGSRLDGGLWEVEVNPL